MSDNAEHEVDYTPREVLTDIALVVFATFSASRIAAPFVTFAIAAGGTTFTFFRRYYVICLKGSRLGKTARNRKSYDELRTRLEQGGGLKRTYEVTLTYTLDWLESFVGDKGRLCRLSLARIFGLVNPVPIWSAPMFDLCLLISLIYPILSVLLSWALSGSTGDAERALGLEGGVSLYDRLEIAGPMVLAIGFFWLFAYTDGLLAIVWGLASGLGFVVGTLREANTIYFPNAYVGAISGAGAVIGAVLGAKGLVLEAKGFVLRSKGAVGGLGAITVAAIISVAVNFSAEIEQGSILWALIIISASTSLSFFTTTVVYYARRENLQYLLFCTWMPLTFLSVLSLCANLSRNAYWHNVGSLLLFFGMLPIINAPFDWVSIGFTRGFLRRGIEKGEWWPVVYAIGDLFADLTLLFILLFAIVLGIGLFEDVSAFWCGAPILSISSLLAGVSSGSLDPKYFWLYTTLMSTMVPSLVSLCLGIMSLIRGVPFINRTLVKHLPESGHVEQTVMYWMPVALASHVLVGIILSVSGTISLLFLLFNFYPGFLLWVVHVCEQIAQVDIPRYALQAVGVRNTGCGRP